jgi:hypothetical protein
MQSNESAIQEEILNAGFGRDSFVFEVLRRFFEEDRSMFIDSEQDIPHIRNKKKGNILDMFFRGNYKYIEDVIWGDSVNCIPGRPGAPCRSYLFAAAIKSGNTVGGFEYAMKEIVKNWLSCYNQNEETVFITTEWKAKEFDYWQDYFDIQRRAGKSIVVLFCSKSGDLSLQYPLKK